jgi:hypothetical protein
MAMSHSTAARTFNVAVSGNGRAETQRLCNSK